MTGPASPRSLPAIPLPAGAAAGAPRVSPLAPAAAVSHRRSAQSWLADFLAAPPQTDDCVRWPYLRGRVDPYSALPSATIRTKRGRGEASDEWADHIQETDQ